LLLSKVQSTLVRPPERAASRVSRLAGNPGLTRRFAVSLEWFE